MVTRALLVMAKRPFPGQTKTRLCPPLSPVQAAQLYACFLQDTLDMARAIPGIVPFIAYTPPQEGAYFAHLAPDFRLVPQQGSRLNERLEFVLDHCLQQGFTQVAAINSDSPHLPAAYVQQAFAHLDNAAVDVVLGPCRDGGYYLIGWKRPLPQLLRQVRMSTPSVLKETLAIAQQDNLQVALLPQWEDIDEAADLKKAATSPHLRQHTHAFLAALPIQELM